MPTSSRIAALAGVLLLCGAAAADWPIFRGNALQNGVTDEKLPDKLEILWKFKADDAVEATPAVVKDTVYVGSFDEHLYAINLADGKEKWKYKAGTFKSPVSVRGDTVYAGDADGVFHAVDAKKGTKRWTFETEGEITSGANFAGDNVIFGSYDSSLYCLDAAGKKVWKFKTQGPVNGSPAIADNRTFVAGCDGKMHVIDIKTGKPESQIELGAPAGATAASYKNRLYVGTMEDQFLAIDLAKKEIAWTYEPKSAQAFYGSAAVTEKFVVVGCRDRNVHCIDRAKGTEVWTFPTKGKVDSSPVIAGDRVYFGSADGHLYVLDLEKGREIQKFKLGRGILGGPAVAEGRIVVGTTDGFVVCLGKKD